MKDKVSIVKNEDQELQKVELFFKISAAFFISFSITVLSQFNKDIFVLALMLFIIAFLYIISSKTKYKILLRLLTLFLVFHLIIFPYIYVYLLKSDPNSFKIDNAIFNNEKNDSLVGINTEYTPLNLKQNIDLISDILNDKSVALDSTINFLKSGNLLIIEKYILRFDTNNTGPPMHPAQDQFYIHTKNGLIISEFEGDISILNITIRNFLKYQKDDNIKKLDRFNKSLKKITVKSDIWSYQKILPYSINILFTGNMNPKTRTANIIHFIHELSVVFVILVLMGGFLFETLKNKK